MDLGGYCGSIIMRQLHENKIDDTVLPSLTAEDLKDLGDGDRRSCSTPSQPCALSERKYQRHFPTLPATDEAATDTAGWLFRNHG